MSDCPMNGVDEDEEKIQGLLGLLRGGVAAEGSSREEIEEISETLASSVTNEIINQ